VIDAKAQAIASAKGKPGAQAELAAIANRSGVSDHLRGMAVVQSASYYGSGGDFVARPDARLLGGPKVDARLR
jgi:hypothetical protein